MTTPPIDDATPRRALTRAGVARGDGSLIPGLAFYRQSQQGSHEGSTLVPSGDDNVTIDPARSSSQVPDSQDPSIEPARSGYVTPDSTHAIIDPTGSGLVIPDGKNAAADIIRLPSVVPDGKNAAADTTRLPSVVPDDKNAVIDTTRFTSVVPDDKNTVNDTTRFTSIVPDDKNTVNDTTRFPPIIPFDNNVTFGRVQSIGKAPTVDASLPVHANAVTYENNNPIDCPTWSGQPGTRVYQVSSHAPALTTNIEQKLDAITAALTALSGALAESHRTQTGPSPTPRQPDVATGCRTQAAMGKSSYTPVSVQFNANPIPTAPPVRGGGYGASIPVYPIHTGGRIHSGTVPMGGPRVPPGIAPHYPEHSRSPPYHTPTEPYGSFGDFPDGHYIQQESPQLASRFNPYNEVAPCFGCGRHPCASPISDNRLQKELKTVKLLRAPDHGKFKGINDTRSGLSFRLEVSRNCGRMSPIVVYHYLRENISTDVYRTIGINNDWPYNCELDYGAAVQNIWHSLETVYSGQSTSEKLLEAWNELRQDPSESVQQYINRVYCAQEELSLAGAVRSETEVRAKLRCGLRDLRLQGDMLQFNNLPLGAFVAMMSQKVIDYDRQAGQSYTSVAKPVGHVAQFQLGWANALPSPASVAVTAPAPLGGSPLMVMDLDETFLNGVQPGPLPDGSQGCARGCKDPACKGVRTCKLQKPILPASACFYCARSHGEVRETDCPAYRKVCARCNQVGHFAAACRSPPLTSGRRHGKGKGKGKSRSRDDSDPPSSSNNTSGPSTQSEAAEVSLDGFPTAGCSTAEIYTLLATVSPSVAKTDLPSCRLRGVKVQAPVSIQLVTQGGHDTPRIFDKCVVMALWDSGASGNFVRYDIIEKILGRAPKGGASGNIAILADGSRIESVGICKLLVHTSRCTATIAAFVVKHLTCPLVLGTPGLSALGVRIDFIKAGSVSISTGNKQAPGEPQQCCSAANSGGAITHIETKSSKEGSPAHESPQHSSSCAPMALVDDETMTVALMDLSPGHHHRHLGNSLNFDANLNHIDLSEATSHEETFPLLGTSTKRVLPPHQCIHIDTLQDGRFAIDFDVSLPSLRRSAGSGWKAAVARAAKACSKLSTKEKLQADAAITKLLTSGYVSYMSLHDTSRPPPPRVIHNMYCNNAMVKDSYLVSNRYLQENLPAFIGAQYIYKESSSTTPCRIVYDCRPTNNLLTSPTSTRWCLHEYLLACCTHPTVTFMDIQQAYNQLVMAPSASATCGTVIQRPSLPSSPSPRPIMILWVSVAFGMAPSGGALELATAHVYLEARNLLHTLCPALHSEADQHTNVTPLPAVYESSYYDHARPVLAAAFSRDGSIVQQLSSSLIWRDYVDDWAVLGHHYLQSVRCSNIISACGNYHKFTFPPTKTHETWNLTATSTVLGYELTDGDCLRPILTVKPLPHDGTVTKRMASSALAALYDPLGRYLEANMNARLVWRNVVESVKSIYPTCPPSRSWNCKLPDTITVEINEWIARVRALPSVPRFVPVRPGPILESAGHCRHRCEIIISSDASNRAWSVDTRTRLDQLPIGPRLRARGGLFPQAQHKSQPTQTTLTTPRRELHGLLQASKEALTLCKACGLDPSMNCSVTVITDSLINLQRLQWIGIKDREELEPLLHKARKRVMTTSDLTKLLAIRTNLLRASVSVQSIRVLHVPSALNIADAASRCLPEPIGEENLRILESILDSPNPDVRPSYVPQPLTDPEEGPRHEAPPESACLCGSTPAPTAGPLPTPLVDDDNLPTLTAEEVNSGEFEASIEDSVRQDSVHDAIFNYLANHVITPEFGSNRLRKLSNQYKVINNRLFRCTLQRPGGSVVKQRVVGAGAQKLQQKLVYTNHLALNHLGPKKLWLRLQETYYWAGMRKSITRFLKHCRPCLRTRATRSFRSSAGVKNVANLLAGQVVGVDVYLPNLKNAPLGPAADGQVSGCLVFTDLATGFLRTHVVRGPLTSASVVEGLQTVFANSVNPALLLSDNDRSLIANTVASYCSSRGIVHLTAPVYSPALCMWERGHLEITKGLRSCVSDSSTLFRQRPWWEIVISICDNLNDCPYDEDCWITPRMVMYPQFSPEAFYGTRNSSVNDVFSKLTPTINSDLAEKIRADSCRNYKLRVIDYLAHWQAFRERSRARTLTGIGKPCDLSPQDLVYHLRDGASKLEDRVRGPYEVVAYEEARSTAILCGGNGQRFRAWVCNLVKIPSREPIDEDPIDESHVAGDPSHAAAATADTVERITVPAKNYLDRPPHHWSLDDLPPIAVLPPPRREPPVQGQIHQCVISTDDCYLYY